VELAVARLEADWVSADQRVRVARILRRFVGFCDRGFCVQALTDVSPVLAERFVLAPDGEADEPSLALVHLRRTALRLLFRATRAAGWPVGDPTLDLVLPARRGRQTRPLTDEEVTLCRGAALWSLSDTRRSSAWALAEATCRTGELPFLSVDDLDLESGRVWIHGGRRTLPRWGRLTDWGTVHLRRRLAIIGDAPHAPLVYEGGDRRDGGRVSTSLALLDVLRRAGLGDEPGVRPGSIAAWAGRRVLAEAGRIDEAARAMGLRSLDRTAEVVGWDWLEGPDT
jgi:integrase/recombinase XerC